MELNASAKEVVPMELAYPFAKSEVSSRAFAIPRQMHVKCAVVNLLMILAPLSSLSMFLRMECPVSTGFAIM